MLYLVPTPIGNIEDITLRALRFFRESRYFICEDTRTTKKLFQLLDIPYKWGKDVEAKEFFSLTSFTDKGKLRHYVNIIKEHDVVMVSDAGTPGLSDPGKKLIELCNEYQLPYSVFPWANALVPAVVSAWFDTSSFVFLWFLPQKKWRQTALKNIIEKRYGEIPVFFYESVHRVEKLFSQLKAFWFEWKVCICREISKLHEQIINAHLDEVLTMLGDGTLVIKGEFVIGLYVS